MDGIVVHENVTKGLEQEARLVASEVLRSLGGDSALVKELVSTPNVHVWVVKIDSVDHYASCDSSGLVWLHDSWEGIIFC